MLGNMPRFMTSQDEQEKSAQLTHAVGGGQSRRVARPGMPQKPFINFSNLAFEASVNGINSPIRAGNDSRIYLLLQNQGALPVYLGFGQPSSGVIIQPSASYEINPHAPNCAIYVWTTSGVSQCVIIEGTQ